MRWLLAAGLAVALAVVGYAWYRGGKDPLLLADGGDHSFHDRRDFA